MKKRVWVDIIPQMFILSNDVEDMKGFFEINVGYSKDINTKKYRIVNVRSVQAP